MFHRTRPLNGVFRFYCSCAGRLFAIFHLGCWNPNARLTNPSERSSRQIFIAVRDKSTPSLADQRGEKTRGISRRNPLGMFSHCEERKLVCVASPHEPSTFSIQKERHKPPRAFQ